MEIFADVVSESTGYLTKCIVYKAFANSVIFMSSDGQPLSFSFWLLQVYMIFEVE